MLKKASQTRQNYLLFDFFNALRHNTVMRFFLSFFLFLSIQANPIIFNGKVHSFSENGGTLKIISSYENQKFLKSGDEISLSREKNVNGYCDAKLVSKSTQLLLLKLADYQKCKNYNGLVVGDELYLKSEDLAVNMEVAQTLIEVLLKKKLALEGLKNQVAYKLKSKSSRETQVNIKYDILKTELEQKKQNELEQLQREFQKEEEASRDLETRLNEVYSKLELYKIESPQIQEDRWAISK